MSASVLVPADADFVALFSSNRQFLNEVVACTSKIVLPCSITSMFKTFSPWKSMIQSDYLTMLNLSSMKTSIQ